MPKIGFQTNINFISAEIAKTWLC